MIGDPALTSHFANRRLALLLLLLTLGLVPRHGEMAGHDSATRGTPM